MRERVKIPSRLQASNHAAAEPLRRGRFGEAFRALRAWSISHPDPCTPLSRAMRERISKSQPQ